MGELKRKCRIAGMGCSIYPLSSTGGGAKTYFCPRGRGGRSGPLSEGEGALTYRPRTKFPLVATLISRHTVESRKSGKYASEGRRGKALLDVRGGGGGCEHLSHLPCPWTINGTTLSLAPLTGGSHP